MRRFLLPIGLAALAAASPAHAASRAGSLDRSFGTDGARTLSGGPIPSIALDPKQRIVALTTGGRRSAAIWRLLPSGRLDRRLPRNGKPLKVRAAEEVAPLDDGGFLVTGPFDSCTKYSCDEPEGVSLTRFDAELRRNAAYGTAGERYLDDVGGQTADAEVRPDGSAVTFSWGGRPDIVSLDPAGTVRNRLEYPSNVASPALELDPQGRLLAAVLSSQLEIRRYSGSLELDPSYGTGGVTIVQEHGTDPDHTRRVPSDPAVHALPDGGAIVLAGGHVTRLTATGQVAGRFRLPYWFHATALTADRRGRALLAGNARSTASAPQRPSRAAVMRLTRNAQRDRSFGRNGLFTWRPRSEAAAIALDRRGRIVVGAGLYSKRELASENPVPTPVVLRVR